LREPAWTFQCNSSKELAKSFHFNDSMGKTVLELKADGSMVVGGNPNEAAEIFLKDLREMYGTLPNKLEQAERKIRELEEEIKLKDVVARTELD
jgi:hypothetical protein